MKLVILLSAVAVLVGCSNSSNKQTFDISPCYVSPPPTLSGNTSTDLVSLSSAWIEQTSNLGRCNDKLTKIRDTLKGEK